MVIVSSPTATERSCVDGEPWIEAFCSGMGTREEANGEAPFEKGTSGLLVELNEEVPLTGEFERNRCATRWHVIDDMRASRAKSSRGSTGLIGNGDVRPRSSAGTACANRPDVRVAATARLRLVSAGKGVGEGARKFCCCGVGSAGGGGSEPVGGGRGGGRPKCTNGFAGAASVLTRCCEPNRFSGVEVDAKCGNGDGIDEGTMNTDDGEGELDCTNVPGAGAGRHGWVSAGRAPGAGGRAPRRGNFQWRNASSVSIESGFFPFGVGGVTSGAARRWRRCCCSRWRPRTRDGRAHRRAENTRDEELGSDVARAGRGERVGRGLIYVCTGGG
jgi:hypothetical protein